MFFVAHLVYLDDQTALESRIIHRASRWWCKLTDGRTAISHASAPGLVPGTDVVEDCVVGSIVELTPDRMLAGVMTDERRADSVLFIFACLLLFVFMYEQFVIFIA